jgi:hypothetical protein
LQTFAGQAEGMVVEELAASVQEIAHRHALCAAFFRTRMGGYLVNGPELNTFYRLECKSHDLLDLSSRLT